MRRKTKLGLRALGLLLFVSTAMRVNRRVSAPGDGHDGRGAMNVMVTP